MNQRASRHMIALMITCTTVLITLLVIISCNQSGSSKTYSTETRLTSSTLASATGTRAAINAAVLPIRDTEPQASSCPTNKVCLTPTVLEGRIYSGGLMVGGNGNGSGIALTTIGASQEVRNRPDLGKDGSITFNLKTTTDISGDYSCCGGPIAYPSDSDAVVSRLEFHFDYVDTTFVVPSTAGSTIAGSTYSVRTVYVSDTTVTDIVSGASTTIYRGDKLVKGPNETTFKWCDATTCATTRPTSDLVKDSAVANWTPAKEGNSNYVVFSVSLNSPITFTKADAEAGNWRFTVDFDTAKAAVFNATDWSSVTSVRDLLNVFQLIGDPGSQGTSVTVNFSKAQL